MWPGKLDSVQMVSAGFGWHETSVYYFPKLKWEFC